MSDKKVLILINVRWWNATAFYAVNLGRVLRKNGFKIFIGCKKEWPPYIKAKKMGFETLDFDFYGYNIFRLIKNFIKMIRFIKTNNISVINAHRSEDHSFSALAKVFTDTKFVLTRGDRRTIKNNFFSKKIYYKSADKIMLTSNSIYKANKNFLQVVNNKISVIYGSVDEDNFKVKHNRNYILKKYRIPARRIIVGMAGRYDYVKDQYTFMNAAFNVLEKNKNVHFVLAGKEEHIKIKELKNLALKHKAEKHFTFLEIINEIPSLINIFDIGIITSVDSETISRVGLEYMYLGKPVIGTKVNAVGEIIKNRVNGFIFNPGDDKSLAKYIVKLIKNKNERKKLGKNSKELYDAYYSDKIFYNKVNRLFQ